MNVFSYVFIRGVSAAAFRFFVHGGRAVRAACLDEWTVEIGSRFRVAAAGGKEAVSPLCRSCSGEPAAGHSGKGSVNLAAGKGEDHEPNRPAVQSAIVQIPLRGAPDPPLLSGVDGFRGQTHAAAHPGFHLDEAQAPVLSLGDDVDLAERTPELALQDPPAFREQHTGCELLAEIADQFLIGLRRPGYHRPGESMPGFRCTGRTLPGPDIIYTTG